MSDRIARENSGVLMGMMMCNMGALDRKMRGDFVAMLHRLLAEVHGILCW